ncbi:uncharacterized protein J4E78_005782 [Alternaria triticimaculans]|uniref:uncharacterized protein n=1 Tax=Alternaria triticimaculans TaxID=297637 RepID=UPI0020C1DC5A|nr:uncharacterized protein J4E78_005782 [Alternaria triticimaculans]KAI4659355.1 hypothetical protein J4E78_005782 [Alternaria triticimaculans]
MENNLRAIDNVTTLKESLETVSRSDDICVEKNGEYIIDDVERLTFECKAVLGKGGDAVVEKVQHRITKAIFAKKVIQFPHKKSKGRDQAKGRYYNEVAIIRKLKAHPHMIELFATYMTPQSGGLILSPAADQGDLKQYLEHYVDALDDSTTAPAVIARMTTVLEKTFGCLSSGLAHMHAMGIRHKDIKPANILIHKGAVVYTDFGASKDTLEERECTTEGRPDFLTRKYSAPEVLEYEKRNFAADVFSVLFSEATGGDAVNVLQKVNNATDYNDSVSIVKYGEMVHTQVRRFIVVKHKREFCFAVPILTYQGQGTKKVVSPGKHAIAYSHGYDPRLLPDERPLAKHAICIVMNNGENPLVAASRIYFGVHHPVQYNVKVKDLGIVHQDWLPTFIGYWHMETLSDTQKSDDSTEKAA